MTITGEFASTAKKSKLALATLGALGIVFGDIGTSPLYAFRECFAGSHGVPVRTENLMGAASLILWSLILVVSVKYLFIILRLDNRGEGGILALSALIRGALAKRMRKADKHILMLGLVGAALIYADGMLTPAITVLSAVEGLQVSLPAVGDHSVFIAVCILAGLFAIQRYGTEKVGGMFGPLVLLWFVVMAVLGCVAIAKHPSVLLALSPHEGLIFLIHQWHHAFPLLAAVFLAVTGGEALYADLGHFGAGPIRMGWFSVALPALALNYLGQAALLSSDPSAIENPFFLLAPDSLRLPLTFLATGAAIVASQALITGAFSLTTQAIQLGCLPRVKFQYTSEHSVGQVYVPSVNWLLAVACILLVVTLRTSTSLAGAYGIAIALTMTITSLLFYKASRVIWDWPVWKAAGLTSLFLIIDFAFLAANALKIAHNGWIPLTVAGALSFLMLTWLWGRKRLHQRMQRDSLPVDTLLGDLAKGNIHRVRGTAIYMSGKGIHVPTSLLHNLKHNQVLHERVFLLHAVTLDVPHADSKERLEVTELGEGLHCLLVRFGFADFPDIPHTLRTGLPADLRFNPGNATYFLGRETYHVGRNVGVFHRLRLALFAAMARNASPATAYFQLPPGRVVELGAQITL